MSEEKPREGWLNRYEKDGATVYYWSCMVSQGAERFVPADLATPAQWQPIESAPKDGIRVLLYWPYWNQNRAVMGSWSKHHEEWDSPEALHRKGPQPLSWMPVPAVPSPPVVPAAKENHHE